ncbi:MAG: DedA family protein [Alphaproteobacteria bacterium]|nr:DedA family protein [Alphaproteobacteria bacterium]
MITRLYSRTLAIAAHRHAMAVMALISFAESSFLPLPPDVLLIPMTLAQPRRAWLIATVCTISSVLGAYVGYAIGFFLFDTIGLRVLDFYHLMDKYEAFKAAFAQWGAWIIIIKGLTPIPYKLVTIASGAAQFNLSTFTLASLVSRGLRFFVLAALLWRFGEPIRDFIERRLMLVTSLVAALLVGGVVVLRYL